MAATNEFKAAAERKKRMSETRKAKTLIERLEGFLNEPTQKLNAEDIASLQDSLNKLKELSTDASVEVALIMNANEEAQTILDAINEKMAQQEEPASVEEPQEQETPEEITEEAPVVSEEAQPAPQEEPEEKKEEAPAAKEAEEETGEMKISDILRQMYAAPRYSRVEGETRARFSAMIKPSLREKMEADKAAGRIKSPNDLINGLLEIFYGDE